MAAVLGLFALTSFTVLAQQSAPDSEIVLPTECQPREEHLKRATNPTCCNSEAVQIARRLTRTRSK